jgi:hypothetical protein
MNKLIEIAKKSGFEVSESEVFISNYRSQFDITKKLQTFADLIRAEDAKKIAEISNDWIVRGYKLIDTETKLTLAVEALECALSDDKPYILKCKETLNKIKGE